MQINDSLMFVLFLLLISFVLKSASPENESTPYLHRKTIHFFVYVRMLVRDGIWFDLLWNVCSSTFEKNSPHQSIDFATNLEYAIPKWLFYRKGTPNDY